MDGKRFLNSVKFTNLLSFGPDGMELELHPLNILIGPNASGKSNFIDAMRILQMIFVDISSPFSKGGNTSDWLWKGDRYREFCSISLSMYGESGSFVYSVDIFADKPRPSFKFERINFTDKLGNQAVISDSHSDQNSISNFYNFEKVSLELKNNSLFRNENAWFAKELNKLKDLRIYSDYELGRYSKIRIPQNASLDPGDIFEGFGNLSLVINDLVSRPDILSKIVEKMKIFYSDIVNVNTRTAFGTIQLYLQEKNVSETIPATRLSDGTIRFLSLIAVLLHPEPPPLICLEEPEIGMHPDILPAIAEMLIDASQRTQLIVTTHSDILLSAIGKTCPEAVVVCEKGTSGTNMTRPDPEQLSKWIEENSDLGNVWLSGLIGGNRW
ncbi:AAA family ATPase [Armatimonas sp.]|uniref:AAA family ATPase n=1 Tax=Armatimonas sp. TaxID=1872638 RepID=UPI00374CE718